MRALQLIADRKLELVDLPDPAAAGRGRGADPHQGGRAQPSRRVGFSRHGLRQAQAAAGRGRRSIRRDRGGRRRRHVVQNRRSSRDVWRADLRAMPRLPRGPRQSVRERRRHHGLPCRRLRARADQFAGAAGHPGAGRRSLRDAACAPIAFGTVEHMLFDNAKLKPGETILVHAGGSGIGSVAIKMAKASAAP